MTNLIEGTPLVSCAINGVYQPEEVIHVIHYLQTELVKRDTEIAVLKDNFTDMHKEWRKSHDECDALKSEVERLTADAKRYQWLREQNADLEAGFYVGNETDALPEDITWVGSDLDAAIDEAMK